MPYPCAAYQLPISVQTSTSKRWSMISTQSYTHQITKGETIGEALSWDGLITQVPTSHHNFCTMVYSHLHLLTRRHFYFSKGFSTSVHLLMVTSSSLLLPSFKSPLDLRFSIPRPTTVTTILVVCQDTQTMAHQ